MNILIIGSGGREHSFAKLLNHKKYYNDVFTYGENLNYGMKRLSKYYYVGKLDNFSKISQIINVNKIELVFIGPEKPIVEGIVNYLIKFNPEIKCFAPTLNNARIESSKIFARTLMDNNDLNMYSPKYRIINAPKFFNWTIEEINNYLLELIQEFNGNYVIKPDGLTGGKGVKLVPEDLNNEKEILDYIYEILNLTIDQNQKKCVDFNRNCSLLIEEKLEGEEFSIFSVTDGINSIHSPPFQDFKKLNGSSGPMTGGMGCQSFGNDIPPFLNSTEDITTAHKVNEKVIESLLNHNYKNGHIEPYKGVLYGSFMKVKNKSDNNNDNNKDDYDNNNENPHKIYVIEFNCRFGDPETINLCSVLDENKTDLNKILESASVTSDNVIFNIPNQNLTQNNLDKYKYRNKKFFRLNNYNWYFNNKYSLSKYLVDLEYPLKNTKNDKVEISIHNNLYWLLNNHVICANINSDLISNKIFCGKSRCFSIVLTQQDKKNMKELEKQLNIFLEQVSQNRFYYIKNMV